MITDCLEWSKEIFSDCDLGDKRLVDRLVKMGCYLSSRVGSHLSSCFEGNHSEMVGAYRFIRNDSVSPEAITAGICKSTMNKVQSQDCLLAIEDTTSLSYKHAAKIELGYVTNCNMPNSAKGFMVHTTILYDPQKGQTLGLINQNLWKRSSDSYGKRHNRKQRTYQEKESFKWEAASTRIANCMGSKMNRLISVCDREADIFAYLMYKQSSGERFIVRAAQDRALYDEPGSYLSDAIMGSDRLGRFEVQVTQKGGRKARKAQVELRASPVEIKVPRTADAALPEVIKMNGVAVTEISPPSGQKALSWVLLTDEPITDFNEVRKIVYFYEKRWLIEEFHKCWKSGVKVEKMRMQSADNLERMIALLAPIAIRLLQLRESLVAENEKRSCTEVLNKDEFLVLWRSIEKKKRIPAKEPPLNWAYRAIARLGGWNDSKRTGKACWSKLWEGWFLLDQRVQGYTLAKEFT